MHGNEGMKWYNNGSENRMFRDGTVPKGWHPGMLDKGKKWYNNGAENRLLAAGEVSVGWEPGILPYKGSRHSGPKKHYYNNGVSEARFPEGAEIPEGWVPGRIPNSSPSRGSHWHTNGIENRMVKAGEEPPKGFVPGTSFKGKMKTYNNGVMARRFADGEVPEGFVHGLGPYSEEQRAEIAERKKATCQKHWHTDNPMQSSEVQDRQQQSLLKNHGARHALQLPEYQEAFYQTMLERHGVRHALQSGDFQRKARQTCQSRYKKDHYTQTEEYRVRHNQTCVKKYGFPNQMQSPKVQEKLRNTVQKKYHVNWPCQLPWVRASYSNDSRPNREFASLLASLGIPYEREFPLGSYSYDFKVGNTLVEIDPSPTHNSAWSPFPGREGKPADYHQKKSRFAEQRGYEVVHVWDWDDAGRVAQQLKPVDLGKCTIRKASPAECRAVLLMGCSDGDICFGLYQGDDLVSAMSFRQDKGSRNFTITACCVSNVSGAAQMLFNHFLQQYNPSSTLAYCDRSKSSGKEYLACGMQLVEEGAPRAHWYNAKTGEHVLEDAESPEGDFVPIYDCGVSSYKWEG